MSVRTPPPLSLHICRAGVSPRRPGCGACAAHLMAPPEAAVQVMQEKGDLVMRNVKTRLLAGGAIAALALCAAAAASGAPAGAKSEAPGLDVQARQCPAEALAGAPAPDHDMPVAPDWRRPSPWTGADAQWLEIERMMQQALCRMQRAEALAAPVQSSSGPNAPLAGETRDHVCMRSIEMTQSGDQPPKIVQHSSGDCAAIGGGLNPGPRA